MPLKNQDVEVKQCTENLLLIKILEASSLQVYTFINKKPNSNDHVDWKSKIKEGLSQNLLSFSFDIL
jgi:hypothetical protein